MNGSKETASRVESPQRATSFIEKAETTVLAVYIAVPVFCCDRLDYKESAKKPEQAGVFNPDVFPKE
ncbi:MAG: hypothetical protein HP048_04285 [Clostridia bacterium]|nr:hypothetical protein [Clostridia bacterium]